ncbi:MAG: hypothetical protein H6905_02215 [Hyphomicrobiales bacterium]|nr:hypothetical protein [Hyphomicrobiales bacterium]
MERNVDLRTSKFLFVPASAVLFALSFFLWAMLGLPEDMPEVPGGRLECISYTPWDRGSTPLQTGYSVSDERMRDDLHILSQYTDCIRIYSASGSEGRVVGIAEHLGLKVLLGLWIAAIKPRTTRKLPPLSNSSTNIAIRCGR